MANAQCIRELFFLKGIPISGIAEKTRFDLKTIRQHVHKDDWCHRSDYSEDLSHSI
jgi:hypothetical protein